MPMKVWMMAIRRDKAWDSSEDQTGITPALVSVHDARGSVKRIFLRAAARSAPIAIHCAVLANPASFGKRVRVNR
jgi:hypothetical protein